MLVFKCTLECCECSSLWLFWTVPDVSSMPVIVIRLHFLALQHLPHHWPSPSSALGEIILTTPYLLFHDIWCVMSANYEAMMVCTGQCAAYWKYCRLIHVSHDTVCVMKKRECSYQCYLHSVVQQGIFPNLPRKFSLIYSYQYCSPLCLLYLKLIGRKYPITIAYECSLGCIFADMFWSACGTWFSRLDCRF